MKDLENVELKESENSGVTFLEWAYGIDDKAVFYFPLKNDELGVCSGISVKGWQHVCLDLEPSQRCPTYEEMCCLKQLFFEENEVTLQVHPPQSEYVNKRLYRLHLWRAKDITKAVEKKLKRKITNMYHEAKKYFTGERKEIFLEEFRVLIIFCGNEWLPWEEVCKIKQRYWEPEQAAVQFNISSELDLNEEHMILLWDAEDFDLPPKEIV